MRRRHLCVWCRGHELPAERTDETHLSVRFGDQADDGYVVVDGVDVTDRASEVHAREGWAVLQCNTNLFLPGAHRCEESDDVCSVLVRGDVRVGLKMEGDERGDHVETTRGAPGPVRPRATR